ncbi:SPbeta phage protein, lytic transglycosylase (plasmid) [Alkalihalophilus pseudofirmus OF4]|uniref:SPbeta phage protein, lytic transglycosylase n=1 Tax=Alkalihalophilus pseudofirmus (strain ATCC BAA-2126 / JCM 17055 / OF4) TaxID=398511 RepID=D3G189_ALKPO|nr:transglycosylase SLT domain-containing protein [Alkalihalophilus pseudofirmus]ADC52115.1 SPbeta phage protein, lytic transglycosylase [Alkalihalophilus pseudofirmus OF4]
MSQENKGSSNDIAKGALGTAGKGVGKGVNLGRAAQSVASGAKLIKLVAGALVKAGALLAKPIVLFFGCLGCLFIIIAVVVLLLIASIPFADFFLKGGERNAAEEYYDTAMVEGIKTNHRHMVAPLRGAFAYTGTWNYEGLEFNDLNDTDWMYRLEEALIPSHAITLALLYNKLSNEKKPEWHKQKVSAINADGEREEFVPNKLVDKEGNISERNKILLDNYARDEALEYYFHHLGGKGLQLTFMHATASDEIERTYTYSQETGTETVTESTMPPRQYVSNVRALYKSVDIPMVKTTTAKRETSRSCYTVTSGEGEDETSVQYCDITYKEYDIWVIDTSTDPEDLVREDPLYILRHLLITAEEGDRTELFHPRDLRIAFEIMKTADPDFPDVEVNFNALTKCYEEKGSIERCLVEVGGGFDMFFFGGGYCTGEFSEYINEASEAFGVDASLIAAIIEVESTWDPTAGSDKGARGLMQLMPLIINYYGVQDPWDPRENIMGGTQYLRDNLNRYGGDLDKAIAAYNAGETAVNRWVREGTWPNIPFTETRNYVPKVKNAIEKLSGDMCEAVEGEVVLAGSMACPMIHPNLRLASPFGMRWGRLHGGMDLGTGQIPTPIYAVMDGVVDRAHHRGSLGYQVTIRHGNVVNGQSFYTVYGHLQPGSIQVRSGQTVKAGTMLAIMGGSGSSGGNNDYDKHLHFETHVGGEWGNYKRNPASLGFNYKACIR